MAKHFSNAKGQERHAIQFSQGSSAYRLQQWAIASRHFSRSLLTDNRKLQEQSHYNLGNALFQSGWSILNPPESNSDKNRNRNRKPFSRAHAPPLCQRPQNNRPTPIKHNSAKPISDTSQPTGRTPLPTTSPPSISIRITTTPCTTARKWKNCSNNFRMLSNKLKRNPKIRNPSKKNRVKATNLSNKKTTRVKAMILKKDSDKNGEGGPEQQIR